MDRHDNSATISLTACALNGHNNSFLDSCKSEGLISLICALNSPPAPTAARFLVLSSLPSHTVSWKRNSGALAVVKSTGWRGRSCLPSWKWARAAGKQKAWHTDSITCKQFQPNMPNIGLCMRSCTTWQHQHSHKRRKSAWYIIQWPQVGGFSQSHYRSACALSIIVHLQEKGGTV